MRRVDKQRVGALIGVAALVWIMVPAGCGSDDASSLDGAYGGDASAYGGYAGSSGFVGSGGATTGGRGGAAGSGGGAAGVGTGGATSSDAAQQTDAGAEAGSDGSVATDAGLLGCTSSCCPTEPECFPSGIASPGAECLAQRTNTPERFQLRQVHRSALAPAGYAEDPLYAAGARAAELPWSACGTPDGSAASVELIDVDLSGSDSTQHVARRGYATRVDAATLDAARTDGLCFFEGTSFDAAWFLDSGLGAAAGTPLGLPPPLPQPWVARPARLERVGDDFDLSTDRAAILSSLAASGSDGVFFYDAATGRWHDYVPIYYQVFYESSGRASVVPAREVETEFSFNSAAMPDCVGALVEPAAGCASSDPLDPAWGCASDGCPGGVPSRTRGYLLTTELEQVWSEVTNSTLCVAAPTLDQAQRDGWSGPGTWGLNCRGSPNWDPEMPNTGLPPGDWCSATNAPSTADCHDAYRIETAQAFSAFPIRPGACHVGPASSPASGACPGSAMVLAADETETVAADGVALSTAGANCAAGANNGGIWAVTASDAGTLRLNAVPERDASGNAADAVISIRSDCAKSTTTRACSRSGPGEVERLALPVAAGETVYVLVQSAAPFELFATLESARCGDGVRNAAEECDFGDTVSGDGCDAACQYETPTSSDVCPGEVMSVSPGESLLLDRHTVGYGDDYGAPCSARVGGPDRVFAVNPTMSGTLRATLSSTFDGVLSVHANCLAPRVGALLACSDGPRADDVESIATGVTGGVQYFVVVDGYRAESFGPFELRIELE